MLADRGRPGEADLADHLAAEQVTANHVGVAIDELDHVAGDARIGKAAHDRAGAARRFLGRLGDHDTARGERWRDLLDHQIDGEIPRAERRDRADGLFQHHRALTRRALHDAALDPLALFGKIFEQRRGRKHFAARLGDRLALLEREQCRDMVGAFADQSGGLAHQRRTLVVEVGRGRDGKLGDRRRGCGVIDRPRLAPLAAPPGAVDEELKVGVVGRGHRAISCLIRSHRTGNGGSSDGAHIGRISDS